MTFIDQGCRSIFPLISTEGGKSLEFTRYGASHVLDESLMIFFSSMAEPMELFV